MPTEPRLILRTCNADMTSRDGFQWKRSGVVVAPDWNPEPECGGGLHGLLNGQGDATLLNWSPDAVWIVAKPGRELVAIDDEKVKCKRATVLYAGNRAGALATLRAAGVTDALSGDVVTAGNKGTATAGHKGTATAGNDGTATAGDDGTATAGHKGTATAGHNGTATAGHYGTATAGYDGTATAGHNGTATAGHYGTATAGDYGIITIRWWDGKRYRLVVGYVGEDGIKPDVAYRCDAFGKFVEVK